MFAPERVAVPAPVLIREPVPLKFVIAPLTVTVWVLLELIVRAALFKPIGPLKVGVASAPLAPMTRAWLLTVLT